MRETEQTPNDSFTSSISNGTEIEGTAPDNQGGGCSTNRKIQSTQKREYRKNSKHQSGQMQRLSSGTSFKKSAYSEAGSQA